MSLTKIFSVITVVLALTILTSPAFAGYDTTLKGLAPGVQFPPEIPRDVRLSDTFTIVEGNEGVGVFRFASEENHYDIFIDHKNSVVLAIKAYIDGEWKFWEYDVHEIPQPISEERFFEVIQLLRNRK